MPSQSVMSPPAQHAARTLPMRLDPADGSIQLGHLTTLICPTLSLEEARIAFVTLMHGERDAGTGSVWAVRPPASACASTGNSSTW